MLAGRKSRAQVSTIRSARADDAAALAGLAERTFRATFAADNSAANMDLHCARSYGAAIQACEISDPALHTLLAECDGELAGFAQLRRAAAAPACVGAAAAEIQRLYVDRSWQGRGVAPQLMETLLKLAARQGATRVWLGVWEHNPRAIAFYEKFGFRVVGDHVFAVGDDPQRDLIMVRSLTAE